MLAPMTKAESDLSTQPAASRRRFSAKRAHVFAVVALAGMSAFCAWGQSSMPETTRAGTKAAFELNILNPRNETSSTTREFVNILGRCSPDAKVTVGGEAALVFGTGLFVRDNVPLQMGENRIAVVATAAGGQKAERVVVLTRVAEAPPPPEPAERQLAIDQESIEPAQNTVLSRGDILDLSFRGTPGQNAEYCLSNGAWQPMAEALDESSGKPSGLYRASIVATTFADITNSPVRFRLQMKPPGTNGFKITGQPLVEVSSEALIGFWDDAKLRLVRVQDNGAAVSFGLHEVRLGGPYLAALPSGTLLRVTGMKGSSYHVRLSPDFDGWIESRAVEWAPAGTPPPHLAFTELSAYGNEVADKVTIPCPARVPFAVTPAVSPSGRAAIEIDFFGAHNAATWLSHHATVKIVREVTVNQVGADHLRLCVEAQEQTALGL